MKKNKKTKKRKKEMSVLPWLTLRNCPGEIVRRLQQGADVNEQDTYGETALYYACLHRRIEIIEILLKNNNINVNLQDTISGWSTFSSACRSNGHESVLLMIQDPRVDINMANDYGMSPLLMACYMGRTTTVQLLLSFGRNIDIYKKSTEDYEDIESGLTALDVAKQKNRTDVVKLLEQYQNNPKEAQKTIRNELNLKG